MKRTLISSVPYSDIQKPQPLGWSSECMNSELDLVYYNYRHYNPQDGRWINCAPIGIQGGFNLYGFVENKVSWIWDELGLLKRNESKNISVQSLNGSPDIKKLLDWKPINNIINPLTVISLIRIDLDYHVLTKAQILCSECGEPSVRNVSHVFLGTTKSGVEIKVYSLSFEAKISNTTDSDNSKENFLSIIYNHDITIDIEYSFFITKTTTVITDPLRTSITFTCDKT